MPTTVLDNLIRSAKIGSRAGGTIQPTPSPDSESRNNVGSDNKENPDSLIMLCLAVFLAAIDVVIITPDLPSIVADLGAANLAFGWIASAYLIALSAAAPLRGKISDIFGRKFVWLVPQWTQNPREACTYLGVDIRGDFVPDFQDLAAGAGGDYRYLVTRRDEHIQLKVQEVALYRKLNDQGPMNGADFALIQAQGYSSYSPDLNQNRGGDYLYLIWKRDYVN
ncbi:hypothetical protein F4814DRAFT_446542 [Daldinia grandis]|nr:hypothetical protein F4814DRAFT_446542 [Daldinia grandis]